jgi:hypothetical protein
MFCDPGYGGPSSDFERAWAAVPGIVQQFAGNEDGDGEPRFGYINGEAKDAITASQDLANAVNVLNAADADYLVPLSMAYSDPAYNIGLALGIYLALNGGVR